MIRMILDCDGGWDDIIGIALAALHPDCLLLAVSVVGGNVRIEEAVREARSILDLVRRDDIPVLQGLGRGARIKSFVKGTNSSTPVLHKLSPQDEILITTRRAILEWPGQVWIVATGPLTNIAALLLAYPDIKKELGGLVFLGGAFHVPGNFSPVAEHNVFEDPESAHLVLTSGIRVLMIPLDVSMKVRLSKQQIDHLDRPGASLLERYLHKSLLASRQYYECVFGFKECPIYDPLAVAAAIDPTIVTARSLAVSVELAGELTRGQTIADFRQEAQLDNVASPVQVAFDADIDRFLRLLMATLARAEP